MGKPIQGSAANVGKSCAHGGAANIRMQTGVGELIFRSPSIKLKAIQGMSGEYDVGCFKVTEEWTPESESPHFLGYGNYVVKFRHLLDNVSKLDHIYREFNAVRLDFEVIWLYTFGAPFNWTVRESEKNHSSGSWSANLSEAVDSIYPKSPYLEFRSQAVSYFQTNAWPLAQLVRMHDACKSLSEEVRFLMKMHSNAFSVTDEWVRLALMARLVDLFPALLPGNREDAINGMPSIFLNRMKYRGKSLFGMANNKRETRHFWDNRNEVLHDRMTREERMDFQSDVDTVARYIIHLKTGQPPVFFDGWKHGPNAAFKNAASPAP